ncbi:MAG: ATP-dependent nuclease [Pseudomonadota bacterium]
MWVIRKIRIKNFRSIVDGAFSPGNISLIVGENDVGKSNYIRALNLFFNGQTDPGRFFSFNSDFSNKAIVGKGKAKQVEVTLEIQPPSSFSDQGLIVWKRFWRDGGVAFDSEQFLRMPGGKPIQLKSKVVQWLRGIRFRYVPAIKGSDYFAALMRELHDTLAITIDNELRAASASFIEVVRSHTKGISSHLSEHINLDSRLQLPENLRSLFEVLDFQTNSDGHDLSLRLRGDGIKVRHIPAVLKFLSDQERELSPIGRPKPTSIWGYEEPENNLELKKAFEHAEEIFSARDSAQIFITTHSPAFYGLAASHANHGVLAFSAKPSSEYGTQLKQVHQTHLSAFDDELGLMPLVTPYIKEKAEELTKANAMIVDLTEKLQNSTRPIILVAGETDKIYISCALDIFDNDLYKKIDVIFLGSSGAEGSKGAGDSNLLRLIEQWRNRPELIGRNIFVVIDCDAPKFPLDLPENIVVHRLKHFNNSVAKIGIENLLPEYVFTEKYYDKKVTKKDYGGKATIETLSKMRLCNSICKEGGEFYLDRYRILANFMHVIIHARNHLFPFA